MEIRLGIDIAEFADFLFALLDLRLWYCSVIKEPIFFCFFISFIEVVVRI